MCVSGNKNEKRIFLPNLITDDYCYLYLNVFLSVGVQIDILTNIDLLDLLFSIRFYTTKL